jgi:hypothetical protein
MHDLLGVGTTHDIKSVMTGVFLASWLFRGYTLGEKLALWRGKVSCDKMLWDKMIATDLTKNKFQSLTYTRLFFSWPVRLHRFLPVGKSISRRIACTDKRVLYFSAFRTQSNVGRAGPNEAAHYKRMYCKERIIYPIAQDREEEEEEDTCKVPYYSQWRL